MHTHTHTHTHAHVHDRSKTVEIIHLPRGLLLQCELGEVIILYVFMLGAGESRVTDTPSSFHLTTYVSSKKNLI